MVKFRLLLVLMAGIASALLGNFYLTFEVGGGFSEDISFWSIFTIITVLPAPFMLISALVMLAFSFLKVEEKDGMLVYDSRNLYWRGMSRIFGWKE